MILPRTIRRAAIVALATLAVSTGLVTAPAHAACDDEEWNVLTDGPPQVALPEPYIGPEGFDPCLSGWQVPEVHVPDHLRSQT